ncbi:hypothetical protein BDW02DRAFT_553571 [Decorospora gaudefroyi]|uniref:Uncharacterized protein n=1 Tax=Decorospora gaudefroyi TaxID=184978 RepID=A0A6A5K6W8_9PLEO|nr:hypothetical protein BDW02DRAFT_553571 [Decorospora gaudefroyi]
MSSSSTIAARCAAIGTSIFQVIPDVSNFARTVRSSRHDVNAINSDLLVVRTGLGIVQNDVSASGSELPDSLIDALSRVLDSCDDTRERLHKIFLKLSCSLSPKDDWRALKDGTLANLRYDLDASKVVLELALDYIALFNHQDNPDSLPPNYASALITASDDLAKRTDTDEIYVNQTARDRLQSLLQAIRLLRSCITAISREGIANAKGSLPFRRTTTPRPDSLEPVLGETPRNGKKGFNGHMQPSSSTGSNKGIGNWLANVPSFDNAPTLLYPIIGPSPAAQRLETPLSRPSMSQSQGTFYTDDGVSSSRTLLPPESRLRKSYSWCTDATMKASNRMQLASRHASRYASTMSGSDVSIFHKKITSDRIAVTKSKRKDMEPDQRAAVDRILANIPAEATSAEVERVIWEGANPMATHPEFGYFFIRAAHEMTTDILSLLVEFGADITRTNAPPNPYHSAMHAATLGAQLVTVQYLASLGHSLHVPDHRGETPLNLAARTSGAYPIAKYLVEAGVDVNHETKEGITALQAVLKEPRLEGKERSLLIELLLAYGAAGEVKRDVEGARGNEKGRSVLGIT